MAAHVVQIALVAAGLLGAASGLRHHRRRLAGPIGRAFDGGGDLLERRCRFLKGRRLLLGPLRQIVGGDPQLLTVATL